MQNLDPTFNLYNIGPINLPDPVVPARDRKSLAWVVYRYGAAPAGNYCGVMVGLDRTCKKVWFKYLNHPTGRAWPKASLLRCKRVSLGAFVTMRLPEENANCDALALVQDKVLELIWPNAKRLELNTLTTQYIAGTLTPQNLSVMYRLREECRSVGVTPPDLSKGARKPVEPVKQAEPPSSFATAEPVPPAAPEAEPFTPSTEEEIREAVREFDPWEHGAFPSLPITIVAAELPHSLRTEAFRAPAQGRFSNVTYSYDERRQKGVLAAISEYSPAGVVFRDISPSPDRNSLPAWQEPLVQYDLAAFLSRRDWPTGLDYESLERIRELYELRDNLHPRSGLPLPIGKMDYRMIDASGNTVQLTEQEAKALYESRRATPTYTPGPTPEAAPPEQTLDAEELIDLADMIQDTADKMHAMLILAGAGKYLSEKLLEMSLGDVLALLYTHDIGLSLRYSHTDEPEDKCPTS